EPSAMWIKEKLGSKYRAHISKEGHYLLLTDSENKERRDERLKILEDTYHNFFYWFAIKGKVLQVPNFRLVAVLERRPGEFKVREVDWNTNPLVAEGFTARRDNVAVFAPKRFDDIYVRLDKFNQGVWEGVPSKEDLLKGTTKNLTVEIANKQLLTLVQQAMDHESELATVTHEGTRQLMAASGLPITPDSGSKWVPMVARNLGSPEWVKFGMASFFETPRMAYWPGSGFPSWLYLVHFKLGIKDKRWEDKVKVLEDVITDTYFNQANGGKNKERIDEARTLAWSLAYYLAHHHLNQLEAYFRELAKLPRNMKFGNSVLRRAF